MGTRTIVAGIAAAAAVGLTATGCGSSSSTGSSNLGGAASVAPSNSVAFVALDSDVSSGQWSTVNELLDKFPGYDKVLAGLSKSFTMRTSISWADDVKPALGSELDLVALPGKKTELVGLTQGSDQQKLAALLHKIDKGIVSEQIDGWTAFSSSRDALDTMTSATTKLSDNNTYQAAIAQLSSDALLRAYANGTAAEQLLASVGRQTPDASTPPFAWASADLIASGDGVRVHGYSRDGSMARVRTGIQPVPPTPYSSSLVDEIPADALFVADFPVTPGQFQFSDTTSLPAPFKKLLGVSPTFLAELDDILGGETALYVRPGLPIPEITIVTQPNDTAGAEHALTDVIDTLRKAAGTVGGLNLASIPIFHDVVGGQLIISTSAQGIADFRSGGPKLSSDPSFQAALKTSAMPSQTTGFIYANLTRALPLVQAIAPLLGLTLPVGSHVDLSALKTLTAYGTRAGEDAAFTVFLQIGG